MPALIVHGGAGADPQDGREELREGILQAVKRRLAEAGPTVTEVMHG